MMVEDKIFKLALLQCGVVQRAG